MFAAGGTSYSSFSPLFSLLRLGEAVVLVCSIFRVGNFIFKFDLLLFFQGGEYIACCLKNLNVFKCIQR